MAKKDRVRPLMKFIAEDKLDRLALEGTSTLQDIERDIGDLREQAALIRTLLGRYARQVAAEGVAPVVERAEDGYTSAERSRLVRQAALELGANGLDVLNAQQVVDHLAKGGVIFSIKRPASMVGSVLASMKEFDRTEMNKFRYTGREGPLEESQAPAPDSNEIPFE
ncbi:MAG: hypothetical protein Q8Q00_13835 [Dehalococcoidia bacterium]|nr:hypothetical protein [Dehalococcoidia bacterium]